MVKLLLILLLSICSFYSYSNVRRVCNVQYQTEEGWSKYYKMEVQFVTGRELNKMAKTFKYSEFTNYCLLWFEKGEVAIIDIGLKFLTVGEDFDSEDFRAAFDFKREIQGTQINGESEREWRIQAKTMFEFIDPRENDN